MGEAEKVEHERARNVDEHIARYEFNPAETQILRAAV